MSGNPFYGEQCTRPLSIAEGRDIFKDGPGDVLTAQLSLIDLKEAIYPPPCPECQCQCHETILLGDVEHCLLEVQKAIQALEPYQRSRWFEKLYQLLWEAREMFHSDWVEGLMQCPKKGWAGEVLAEMKAGRWQEAWRTLRKALRGE